MDSQKITFRILYVSVSHPVFSFRSLILVLFFGLVCISCSAAQTSAPSSAVGKSEPAAKADFSQEPAVIEYLHETMRYENDGSGTRELRSRIRVQTQAGLSVAGQLVFEYNAFDEQIEVRSVRVFKKDGSVVTAGPDAVQDLSAPVTQEAPMYTDVRQKHVTVPGVSIGDAVEYDVAINAKPILQGQFWRIWNFANRMIVLDEQLDLNVPKSRALKIKSTEGLEPSVSIEGDRRLYHWATSNLKTSPPVDLFKNFEFDVIKLLGGNRPPLPPRVMFSTFQSWTEVAEWYAQLERGRRITTPEIRAMAREIAKGQETEEAKAEALYYWVSQNIRYVSLSFGVGRYQPHPAAEVLANRYGDCKDKTTLLESLLEAEGLNAHPALVNIIADVDPDMPNPFQFGHVIAFLKIGDKERWLDTTLGVGPFGYLVPQLRNSQALVGAGAPSAGLRTLPMDFPFSSEYRIGLEGTIDKQGMLDGTVELQTRGDLEVLIRLLNDHVSKDQLAKSAESVLVSRNRFLYGAVQYTDFKVTNPAELARPIKVQFQVKGKLMSVNPGSTPEQLSNSLASLAMSQLQVLSRLPVTDGKADSSGKSQQLPIELKGPRSYSLNLNLTFTDLAKSDSPPPKEFHLAREFAEFESHDSWAGATYHGAKLLDLRVAIIPASESNEYTAFVKKIADAFATSPAPKSESGGAPKPPKSPTVEGKHVVGPGVEELLKRGSDESKRKNWANAIEAFGSATKADPQYPDAWRELGRAHMYVRQYSDADAAFRRYLELAPDDHLAYLNMAWVLYNEKKFEEERELMLKRIAVAPNDGDALFRLGTAYLALHQPERAVSVLERSIVQLPKYVSAHFDLARAYLETHQDLLAQESLRKVLALDDSENELNSIAYLLSEHKAFLDLAEEWSQRSIEVIEKELNNSSLSNLQSGTWMLIARASHYWDTMGWIKFQQGKLDAAEKYLLAAWQISDEPVVESHLGRVYEVQGRRSDATEMYLAALSKIPPNGTLSDDAKETRKRLGDMLGGDSQVSERLEQSRKKVSPLRSVSIANPGGAHGIAQYTVMIDKNSKVTDFSATNPDDSLAGLHEAIRAATVPQTFPDAGLNKLPRLGTLACPGSDQPCSFTLLSPAAASRLAPLD